MIITLSIFYYLYLVVVFLFILYSLFNFYHLLRFGFFSFANIAFMVAYLVIAGALLALSFNLLAVFDWQTPLFSLKIGWLSDFFNLIKL